MQKGKGEKKEREDWYMLIFPHMNAHLCIFLRGLSACGRRGKSSEKKKKKGKKEKLSDTNTPKVLVSTYLGGEEERKKPQNKKKKRKKTRDLIAIPP